MRSGRRRRIGSMDIQATRRSAILSFKLRVDDSFASPREMRYSYYQQLTQPSANNIGTAYAEYKLSGRSVFVKNILNRFSGTEDQNIYCIMEAYVLKTVLVNHPGIGKLYDVIRNPENNIGLELEWHSRGDVFNAIINNPGQFTLDVIKKFLYDVAAAAVYCHSKGVAHCDIKPSNVMITDDGNFCLVDFGSCKFIDNGIAAPFMQVNPVGQRPPEILLGIPWNFTVDVWSLACSIVVLYCISQNIQHPFLFDDETPGPHLIRLCRLFGAIPDEMTTAANVPPQFVCVMKSNEAISDLCGLDKVDNALYNLLLRMFALHPRNRIQASGVSIWDLTSTATTDTAI